MLTLRAVRPGWPARIPCPTPASRKRRPPRYGGYSFPILPDVDEIGATVTILANGEVEESRRFRRKLDGGGFLAYGVGGKAWVEASLPKRINGENWEAVTVKDGLELIEDLYDEAQAYVTARDCTVWQAGLVRVDAVRDFQGVHHAGELLSGLANTPRPGVQKVTLHQDPERNRADTLTVGPRAWHMTGYDKHQESSGRAPEGQLRTETRLHKEQLLSEHAKKGGYMMRQVADMTGERVDQLHRQTFSRACFDREVVGVASVATSIWRCDWLTDAKKRGLWCFLTMPGASTSMGKNQVTEYRRLARELGVTPAAAGGELPDIRVRLDYESGTEVCPGGLGRGGQGRASQPP